MDAKTRRLLHDLRGELARALSGSSEVGRSLSKIRDQGWALYLLVDRKRDDETPEAFELNPLDLTDENPIFKINGSDLSFLKSIGIDPTRRPRRRKKS